MGYLIIQMLLCLLAAALVGFLLGWWIRGARCRTSLEEIEASWRKRLDGCEAELVAMRDTAGDNENEIESLLADRSRLRNELEAAEGKAKSRSAEIDRLKSQLVGAAPAAATVVDPDDLTKIEGVGPKISQLLHDAGYLTFTSVANATAEALKAVLDAVGEGFKMHDPTTWPQQARLAAEGRWSELEDLQDRLDGGKIT